jgi:hypothetical protein
LSFDGVSQYVTFGRATNLGASAFTLETWFNWSGGGVAANTGIGGVMALPLVTRLSAEKDGDARDGNYFLGLRPSDGVVVADMEEGETGTAPGSNHPVIGVTMVTTSVWHHAAVTCDGTNCQLFLDGNLETTVFVGQPPRWDSLQHAAMASSITSTGAPQGYFAGALEDVRIWDHARSASQIASNRYLPIASAPGLLGRWALDETNGTVAHDSSGHAVHGTLVNGPSWVSSDKAPADVVTPAKLVAIDPSRTEALRQAEARRIPPIFRFDATVAGQVETNFRTSFLLTREKFLAALDEAFPRRSPNSQVWTNARFNRLLATFRSRNKDFPLGTNLARTWTSGQSDRTVQSEWAERLREVMTHLIRPDTMPNEAKTGPPQVRLIALGLSNAVPDLDTVERQGQMRSRTNLYTISRARAELQQRSPTNELAIARYLASFLRENCVFDDDLTRRSRARRTDAMFAADHYEPGQVIVKREQLIDGRARAALDELKARTDADGPKARSKAERLAAEAALRQLREQAALAEFKSEHFSAQNRWLLAGLLLIALISSLAFWHLARSRRRHSLLPVPAGRPGAVWTGPPAEGVEVAAWRERALSAEQRAAQASALVRAGLLPQFARWLRQKLVRGLLAERSHLLSTQETAELEMAELERRLAELQAPLEERLRAYQQRIAELEQELAAKGEENRELIKAKIELTRKKLASEQGQGRATWN